MEFLNYALASLAAFSGLWAGAILAFISPEEMKPGKRYFRIMSKAIFILMVLAMAFFFGMEKVFFSIIFVLLSALFMIFAHEMYIYPLLGVFFYIASKDPVYFPIIAGMIFVLGLPRGSLFAYEHRGMKKHRILRKILICNIFFFVIALPLFFL